MQHEPWRPGSEPAGMAPTTVEEASMERSKSFVKALQELKNLRPQLYSASEYCEKSYLHSQQKRMALVNAVDHLGTVAYKLTDLYEQQASEMSTLELKVACLNQQVLTCQTYTDKEVVRQQQMMGASRRHHKHMREIKECRRFLICKPMLILTQRHGLTLQQGPFSGIWFPRSIPNPVDQINLKLPKEKQKRLSLHQVVSAFLDQPTTRHLSSFSSFDNPSGRQIQKAPLRSKSMLAAFFVKHRSAKMKNVSVR